MKRIILTLGVKMQTIYFSQLVVYTSVIKQKA